ncbi:MAG: M23 family metallopeptidase [Candidatus Pollutiaquabacter aromativorans]|jgi:murein DD-endopeptidase MepM/ murein hydrolase activator NlpD
MARKLLTRLKSRFRLVIMNEDTLEEKASFRLRPLNVFVTTGLSIILLITITTFIIAFTGLREYIPGYADVKTQRRVISLLQKADSMQLALTARDIYLENLRRIINGEIPADSVILKPEQLQRYDTIRQLRKSPEDSVLRKEFEAQDLFSLAIDDAGSMSNSIRGFLFFPPLKGTLTNRFDAVRRHYGIDIVSNQNEPIKATLDGTVVIANFTSETGWVIGIQHSNNLFSFYKHNSALLKKVGDYVKAGDAIAIIGNSGELSSGPHLHFELWFNGTALDPVKYVAL